VRSAVQHRLHRVPSALRSAPVAAVEWVRLFQLPLFRTVHSSCGVTTGYSFPSHSVARTLLSFIPPPPPALTTFCILCLASFAFKLLTNYSQNSLICLRMQTVANPNQLLLFLFKYFSNISHTKLRKYPRLFKWFWKVILFYLFHQCFLINFSIVLCTI